MFARLMADLPRVLGHADSEAHNLRWREGEVWVVHDWDSLGWQPEAALVGAPCGTFASHSPPTLAPVGHSAAFLDAYQDLRGRRSTAEESDGGVGGRPVARGAQRALGGPARRRPGVR